MPLTSKGTTCWKFETHVLHWKLVGNHPRKPVWHTRDFRWRSVVGTPLAATGMIPATPIHHTLRRSTGHLYIQETNHQPAHHAGAVLALTKDSVAYSRKQSAKERIPALIWDAKQTPPGSPIVVVMLSHAEVLANNFLGTHIYHDYRVPGEKHKNMRENHWFPRQI